MSGYDNRSCRGSWGYETRDTGGRLLWPAEPRLSGRLSHRRRKKGSKLIR